MMVLTETTGESQTTFLHSENETCLLMTLFTKSINRKFSFKFGTGTFEFRVSLRTFPLTNTRIFIIILLPLIFKPSLYL